MGVEADIVRLFEETDKASGPLTGLVNNAGINGLVHRSADNYDFKEAMDILAVNTRWRSDLPPRRHQAHVDEVRRQGRQHREHLFDRRADRIARPVYSHYAGSKAAVDTMTKGLAVEVARDGVRVNSISSWHDRYADPC